MKRFWLTRSVGGLAAVLVVFAVVFAATAGFGANRVLRPHGHDSASVCDRVAKPEINPRRFVSKLKPGQTGCLPQGTYKAKRRFILFARPDVTLTSYPGEHATVVGEIRFAATAERAQVRDLTLNGRNADNILGPLIYADGVVLRDNEITNHHTAICIHITTYTGSGPPTGVVIEGNRIHDCGRLPATNHDHGIYAAEARDTVIRNNVIYDNADRGIQLYPDADGTQVTGNVIDGNGQGVALGGSGSHASDNNLIEHNLITNSTIRYNVEGSWGASVGTGNVVRQNCTVGGAQGVDTGGIQTPADGFVVSDNIVADPGYTDAARGDFRPDSGSPCAALLANRAP